MTILSTSLKNLARRGFNVERILSSRKAEKAAADERMRQERAQAQLKAAQALVSGCRALSNSESSPISLSLLTEPRQAGTMHEPASTTLRRRRPGLPRSNPPAAATPSRRERRQRHPRQPWVSSPTPAQQGHSPAALHLQLALADARWHCWWSETGASVESDGGGRRRIRRQGSLLEFEASVCSTRIEGTSRKQR